MKFYMSYKAFGILYGNKFYWVRFNGWRPWYGVDHRCLCKEEVAFAPCIECGAGTWLRQDDDIA